MNSIQKYLCIIELLSCTLKIFALLLLLSMNSLISSGTCSTRKLLKKTVSVFLQNKTFQCGPTSAYSSRFITYAPTFILLGKLSLKKTPLNLGSFS